MSGRIFGFEIMIDSDFVQKCICDRIFDTEEAHNSSVHLSESVRAQLCT